MGKIILGVSNPKLNEKKKGTVAPVGKIIPTIWERLLETKPEFSKMSGDLTELKNFVNLIPEILNDYDLLNKQFNLVVYLQSLIIINQYLIDLKILENFFFIQEEKMYVRQALGSLISNYSAIINSLQAEGKADVVSYNALRELSFPEDIAYAVVRSKNYTIFNLLKDNPFLLIAFPF